MEIKTCEQYVLALLKNSQEQCDSYEEENSRLKNDLASSVAEIEELKSVITELKTVIDERNKVIKSLKQSEGE